MEYLVCHTCFVLLHVVIHKVLFYVLLTRTDQCPTEPCTDMSPFS